MHELLHVAILTSTIVGAAGLVLLVVWPLVSESPLARPTKIGLAMLVTLAVALLLVEWRFLH